jgi:TIR domain
MADSIQYDAFISYRHTEPDQTFARKLLTELEEAGYKIAIDERDFAPNESFVVEMTRCIRQSRFTLALVSPRYFQGGVAPEESLLQKTLDLDNREGRKRRLIPITLEATETPDWFWGLSGVDFSAANPLVAPIERLKQSLGPPLSRPASEPPAALILKRDVLPYKLIYTRVTAEGVLDWDLSPITPYDDLFDPTDLTGPKPQITLVLYFPDTDYLKSSPLKRFTAVTAICCLKSEQIAADFLQMTTAQKLDLSKPANATHPADRERIFSAISAALGGTFVVSMAVPAALLKAGRKRPEISYQALCNMFLVPLVELHNRLEWRQIHLRPMSVGSCTPKLESLVRTTLREVYPKKGGSTAEIIGENQPELAILGKMARYLAWAVERFYNSNDEKWLAYFERKT